MSDDGPLQVWVRLLEPALGVAADEVDLGAVLDLAREAAHQVARPAAPVTTFLAGYAAGLRGGGRHQIDTAIAIAVAATKASAADHPS